MNDGYRETISHGISYINSSGIASLSKGTYSYQEGISKLAEEIKSAEARLIGAGAGLSTSAGFYYSGERFEHYFFDFAEKYGIKDMYSGGFYPFPKEEIFWAWQSRHIYFNRYVPAPRPVYPALLSLVKDKNYFVITTNVDHQFQKAGFDKKRLFYTQGDYGLLQSVNPAIGKTYNNEEITAKMLESQGFIKGKDGIYDVPPDRKLLMEIPPELVPLCPDDGSRMTTNLRSDDNFTEDDGWRRASAAYSAFLEKNKSRRILFWELGIGMNTPIIIKYPFWAMAAENTESVYACINKGEAFCPDKISERSICLNADIGSTLEELKSIIF